MARLNYLKIASEASMAMHDLEEYLHHSSIEPNLLHMVRLRASQMNGCAYCLDMHWKDARELGETEQRLYELAAWRETAFYTERERAALAWTEALTNIAQTHAPDDLYEELRRHFSEKEIVDLTWAVAAINAWNRVAIGFRSNAGSYRPAHAVTA